MTVTGIVGCFGGVARAVTLSNASKDANRTIKEAIKKNRRNFFLGGHRAAKSQANKNCWVWLYLYSRGSRLSTISVLGDLESGRRDAGAKASAPQSYRRSLGGVVHSVRP